MTAPTVTRAFTPTAVTAEPLSGFFGTGIYTGVQGNVVLLSDASATAGAYTISITGISVTDNAANPVNFTLIFGDAERTNAGESWDITTTGSAWTEFTFSTGPACTVSYDVTGTIASISNPSSAARSASQDLFMATVNPTSLTIVDNEAGSGLQQGFALGFSTTRITVRKDIGGRIDSSDQFVLTIDGAQTSTATTTGAALGLQDKFAQVTVVRPGRFTVSEAMSPTSASLLSAYGTVLTATNATPGGTVPPTDGASPVSFTTTFGDDLTFVYQNALPLTFSKAVDKDFADIGETLRYTVSVSNPNPFAVNGITISDPIPAGTTFDAGSVTSNVPVTGTPPTITIPTLPANTTANVSWRVIVNTAPPIVSPITNSATVTTPFNRGSTNTVSTKISHASVSMTKAVTPLFAQPGETLTYDLVLTNSGNVDANNIVITDAVPAGTTYVPGSITANIGFTGDPTTKITLTSPIPSGATRTVSFQVKVGNGIPTINPIVNTASATFTYTVNPASPDKATGTAFSNPVSTQINAAILSIEKTADKDIAYLGDTITFKIAVTNTGNVTANQVVITDIIPAGAVLQAATLYVSTGYTGSLATGITLTTGIAPGGSVLISFQVIVSAITPLNPLCNTASVTFNFQVNPGSAVTTPGRVVSCPACVMIFRHDFSQQISDLIESVALEEAALAAIANQEGAKIQQMIGMNCVDQQSLICLNRSVTGMLDSISILQAILKQKLNIVDCQISSCNNCGGC